MEKAARIAILVLLLFEVGLLPARAAEGAPASKPDYSKQAAVIESYRIAATFQNDGTGTRDLTMKVRVNSDAGVQANSVLVFPYASANEKTQIDYVRVLHPDGAVVVTPAGSIRDETAPITQQAPEYSDFREKHVAVKGLGPGDVLEYHVRYQITSALVPGQFWFAHDFDTTDIVLDEEFQLNVPAGRAVKVSSARVQPTVKTEGGRRIYLWKTRNLKLQKQRRYRAGLLPPPAILISTFQTWTQVGEWWKSLEEPRVVPTPQITAKAKEITKGLTTEAQKLRAIYSYVALNLHYISVSFGIGRYQPHAAADVLNNQYGDCKDQYTLLASLLRVEGIHAWPAMINSTRRIDPDVPSPGQFDHVISVARTGQKLVWMDTTTEVAPLGLLFSSLQDKQALVIPDGSTPHLAETPALPPQDNFVRLNVDAKMAPDGTLTAKMHDSAGGDRAIVLRIAFRQVSEAQWKDLVQRLSRFEGYGGTVSDVGASSPEDAEHPFTWSYDYTRKNYPDWKNHRVMAPLPGPYLPKVSDDEQATGQPVILGAPAEMRYHAKIVLPHGYMPMVPAAINLTKPYAEYHARYSFRNGALEVERDLITRVSQIAGNDIKDYRSFRKAVNDDGTRYISLTVVSGGGVEAKPSRPDFRTEMSAAVTEASRHNLHAALEAVNRALQAKPHSERALEMAALFHLGLKQPDDAVAAARKAVNEAPADLRAYQTLTQVLWVTGKRDEVVPVWKGFIRRFPQKPAGYANLGSVLMWEKKYLEAFAEFKAASRLNPKEPYFDVSMGNALVKAGDKAGAANAYEKAAALNPTPAMQNNASYFMAEAGLKLPEAEHMATLAVKAEEITTAYIRVASLRDRDLQQMPTLAAYWDTLGWVYFNEGKLTLARKYASASFTLDPEALVADHWSRIDEKLGNRSAAIREEAMAVALSGAQPSGPMNASPYETKAPGTRERLIHLAGAGVGFNSAVSKARDELSRLSSYSISKAGLKPGKADFFVLLSPEAAIEVKFVSGSANLRSASDRIAAIRYHALFPDDVPAKLLRRGTLTCRESASTCDFVLLSPGAVHSVQ